MRTIVGILVTLTVAATTAGCGQELFSRPAGMSSGLAPAPVQAAPAAPEQADAAYLSDIAIRGDGENPGPSAVESALVWSEKYAQAVEKLAAIQQANQDLAERNRKLQSEVDTLKRDLEQAQKELTEANVMLLDVRGELTKWKANVMGFRDEMQLAQQAQIDALRQIIRLLSGEIPDATARPPVGEPAQAPKTKETASVIGS